MTLDRFVACALSTLLVCGGLQGVAHAQTTDAERTNSLVRQALERYASETQSPSPGQARAATPPASSATIPLTLDEAVKLALDQNLDIAVQRLDPQTYDLSLASLRAIYRPTVSSSIGPTSRIQPPTSTLNGGTAGVETATKTYNTGVSQSLPWYGGSFTFSWNNNKQTTNSTVANYNPQFISNFAFALTQPLLQGFRIDSTRQQLLVTRISQQISEAQLRAVITNTLANVRNAYWDFVYSVQVVDAARQSLALAQRLLDDNKIRVEVGTLAPLDVLQSESEVATRQQTLTQVQATQRTAELALKRLIVSGTEDPYWRATLNPTDRPTVVSVAIDLEAAIRTGLDNRTDVQQAKRQLESNNISMRYLRDQTLPSLTLSAGYGAQGVGGAQKVRSGSQVDAPVGSIIPGGYGDALGTLGGLKYPNWNATLNFSYLIGTSSADARVARARIQVAESAAQVRVLELQVATELTNAALQVENTLKRVDSAGAARALVQRRLEAEQSKFDVGMSTTFLVTQAQRDLADAQNTELRAMLDYRKALVDFDRLQQTTSTRTTVITVSTGG
jgi:outer membrane protein